MGNNAEGVEHNHNIQHLRRCQNYKFEYPQVSPAAIHIEPFRGFPNNLAAENQLDLLPFKKCAYET